MADLEVTKVEEQLNHQFLYSVRLSADPNRMEFPIGVQDQGSARANEAAVLASALALAEELEAAARLQLGAESPSGCGRVIQSRDRSRL